MRICFVSGEYPPMQGGVGDFTHKLGCALIVLGHEVAVITSCRAQPQHLEASEIAPLEPLVYPVIHKWNWTSWKTILHLIHDFQCDVLHIQYQTAAYAMHPAINFLPFRLHLNKRRPRVVVTFHDLREPYLFPKAGVVRRWVNLALARWCDAVILTNIEDYEQLKQSHSVIFSEAQNLYLIPIGSNIHPQPPPGYDRASWRHSLGIADNETLLCYFGFLNASKGGEVLFRALAELLRRGHRVKLLMIGGQVGDSDPTNLAYLERVKALGNELGLQEHVLWTGYTPPEEVSANFLAADICVLPYRDGASYRRGSFMAALAHGLPIVSTQPRVPISTLIDGVNILLVPPDNVLATADAIERLISKPMLRTQLAQGAKDLAREFTWERIAEETGRVYYKLLGSTR
ncbi:MAG: glycosyltransferase family 4 protein [Candidatus Hadarchaeum sp.]